MKTIYVLFSCNIWKERSSMRMVAETTSRNRLKAILIEKIKAGDME